MPPLFPATLAFYAVACVLYLAHLVSASPGIARGARVALAVAFASHAIDIGWLCTHGLHPVVNAREALSFASWLICGVYLVASFRNKVPVVGALVVPGTMVLDVAARLTPSHESPHAAASLLGIVHITLASAGVALFAVAAGGAVIYLIAERNLKRHKPGRANGPSLATLDKLNQRCITLGFPLFTVAMVTGAMWVAQLHLNGVFTLQYAISAAAWLLYAVLLLARVTAGWRGRRAALMTLAGFAATAAVLLIYFLRGVTGA
ncbi:MAG TPA: cytochrome c biogenesis protein CcsA [Polyangia bacterium]|nr:cytochrome c biogenesis protein CcsA [Polyangia bacterium]